MKNIEKVGGLNWKARRELARTTEDSHILILLVDDKSKKVRKELLERANIVCEVLAKMYKNSKTFEEKVFVLQKLEIFSQNDELEEVRELLNNMFDDENHEFVILAIKFYRKIFKKIKQLPNMFSGIPETDSEEHLADWVIQLPGYGEALELAENPNLKGKLAHRFVIGQLAFEGNKDYVQKSLYNVLSNGNIEDKTLRYIFGTTESSEFVEEYFFEKPKYAMVICPDTSEEILDALMDEYQSDAEKYHAEAFDKSFVDKYFNVFFTSLIRNPNCGEKTYRKAFELFIKRLGVKWHDSLKALCESKWYSVDILKYMLENNKSITSMLYCSSDILKELDADFLIEKTSILDEYQKEWLLEYVEKMPATLKERLKSDLTTS